MTPQDLLDFIARHPLAVIATVSSEHRPESALIGIAVTDELELIFDTSTRSRKAANLRANPSASLVIGWDNETTLQPEGLADEPDGAELARCRNAYFEVFPEGRARADSPAITYFRITPHWTRYCCFEQDPPTLIEAARIGDDWVTLKCDV